MKSCEFIVLTSLAAAIFVASVAEADEFSNVFPNGFENVEGNDGDGVGGVISESGMRYQQVFDASQFADVPVTHRLIKAHLFRPNGSITFPYSIIAPNNTLRLSTTLVEPGQLNFEFDVNIGHGTETTVLEGDVILSTDNTGPPGGPKDFDIEYDYHRPFFYDPSLGNLLLDLTVRGEVLEAGLDFHDSIDNAAITQWMFSPNPDGSFATAQGTRIPIQTFIFADPGDYDGDGVFDCADIDSLVAEIAAGTHNPYFDITGDNLVDLADRDAWLAEAGAANLPSENPYLLGDATLDGFVDGQDFIEWNTNKFTEIAAWCSGDFNADGFVDGQDFILWNEFKFMSSDVAAPVPEPGTGVLSVVALILLGMAGLRR